MKVFLNGDPSWLVAPASEISTSHCDKHLETGTAIDGILLVVSLIR